MIWLIGGTSNSREIAKRLTREGFEFTVTATTDFGCKLIEAEAANVKEGRLSKEQMIEFIKDNHIQSIIDSSHPYATEVSKNAIEVAENAGIPYLRYERKAEFHPYAHYFNSWEEIVKYLENREGRIFLTIGSKNIKLFAPLGIDRIWARVLPVEQSISECKNMGLPPNQIIGMAGAAFKELNIALFREFKIQYVVSKDSGSEGGVQDKIEAAKALGIEILILKKEDILYPEQTDDYDQITSWAEKTTKNSIPNIDHKKINVHSKHLQKTRN